MGNPVEQNEVFINDTYFPISGPVRRSNFAVTPNPVLFGDTSKAGDSVAMTQLTQSDYSGGSGVHLGNTRTDTSRAWVSDLDTTHHRALTLPLFVTDLGLPSWVPANPVEAAFIIEFNSLLFVAFNTTIGTWLNNAWNGSSDHLCNGPPISGIIWGGNLYLAEYNSNYERRTTAGVWTFGSINPYSFADWDNKLWAVGLTGSPGVVTLWSTTDGTTWTTKNATFLNPRSYFIKLSVYRDATGASALYAHSDTGLWIYDALFDRFLPTEIQYAPTNAANDWMIGVQGPDGRYYTTNGKLGLLAVQTGNPMVITPVGLDRDDGYPAAEDGSIAGLVADENFVYALTLDSTNAATLRGYRGGWHKFWKGNAGTFTTVTPTPICMGTVQGKKRVFWTARNGTGAKVYHMSLPQGALNPRFFTAPDGYQAGPLTHTTPWWPFESEVQRKIHGHFFLQAKNHTSTEKTTIEYATDLDENTWTAVTPISPATNPVTADGLMEFRVPDETGKQFRWVRYRFTQQRGGTATLTPIIEFYTAEVMRTLGATYAYVVEIDLTKPWRDKTPEQLRKKIEDLLDPQVVSGFYKFSWQDELAGVRTHYGRLSRESGQGWSGPDKRGQGRESLTIVVPYHKDVT